MKEEQINTIYDNPLNRYIARQAHKIRLWALVAGSLFTLIIVVMDYLRFPAELSQITIPVKTIFLWIPITLLALKYASKVENKHQDHVFVLFYIVMAQGLIHCYVFYAANGLGITLPKTGLTIILLYAGLLFALPVRLAALSSFIIIAASILTYWMNGNSFQDSMVSLVFYTMISVCCVMINAITTKMISRNYQLLHIIKNQAYTDELTGLYNRRYFYLESIKLTKQAARNGSKFAVVVIDLDNFKQLNDQFGHKYGDAALVSISDVLDSCCQRPFDFATRMGGDEFVLFLFETNRKHTESICHKIINELANLKLKISMHKNAESISASVGVVLVEASQSDYISINDVISSADNLLYAVKRNGKNDYKFSEITATS